MKWEEHKQLYTCGDFYQYYADDEAPFGGIKQEIQRIGISLFLGWIFYLALKTEVWAGELVDIGDMLQVSNNAPMLQCSNA